ncbi:MAG: CPBP family intramembrane metalloprotease [Chloroflexi bacterium]|nr:CPBP family intramembrane metalloprotease [Chloroflexota bacterium]
MTTDANKEFRLAGDVHPTRTEQLVEVSVFLFLIVPAMVVSLFAIQQGRLSFVLVAFSVMAQDLALVSLVLFFLWRNGEPIGRIGWTFTNGWKDIVLGVGLFVLVFFAAGFLESIFRAAGLSAPSTPLPSFLAAKGYAEFLLAFLLVIVVAVAEETIFRGYLILRFKNITRSITAAVLLSTVVFSLGHGYEGSAGIATVGLVGIAFAAVYVWRKSLVAPITMHFLLDFVAIVLLPLLGVT